MNVDKSIQYWSDDVDESLAYDHMEVTTLEENVIVKKGLIERKLQIKSMYLTFNLFLQILLVLKSLFYK